MARDASRRAWAARDRVVRLRSRSAGLLQRESCGAEEWRWPARDGRTGCSTNCARFGDPQADAVVSEIFEDGPVDSVNHLMKTLVRDDGVPSKRLPAAVRRYLGADRRPVRLGRPGPDLGRPALPSPTRARLRGGAGLRVAACLLRRLIGDRDAELGSEHQASAHAQRDSTATRSQVTVASLARHDRANIEHDPRATDAQPVRAGEATLLVCPQALEDCPR